MTSDALAAFWRGETLKVKLAPLIDPFDQDRIDCASYQLAIGSEVYVSPSEESVDPTTVTMRTLDPSEGFAIPPGQFAFLVTEEVVRVPADAIAFISIRAKTKFKGLVNVSGFHVDPGFQGQLTFAVYNAGPVTIHLKRGQPIFLIWYANLDGKSALIKADPVRRGLDPDLISGVSGELQSFASLSKKIKDLEKSLTEKLHAVEKEQMLHKFLAGVIVALAILVAGNWIRQAFFETRAIAPTNDVPAQHPSPPSTNPASSPAPPIEPREATPPSAIEAPKEADPHP